jgi:DNA polymerase III delta prime subunit
MNDIKFTTRETNSYNLATLYNNRIKEKKNTLVSKISILTDKVRWSSWLIKNYYHQCITQYDQKTGLVNFDDDTAFTYQVESNSVNIDIIGDLKFADRIKEELSHSFEIMNTFIRWIYDEHGSEIIVPVLSSSKLPSNNMYNFLGEETLEQYYERYMQSSASVLLLIGPPGTGKTTFIRGFLEYTKSSAIVCYDAAILNKDWIFAGFLGGEDSVIVMEDSDEFLSTRVDGNKMMQKFLNVSDGLISALSKKMIFSTNLPSIKDVDSALIRPGRCHDVLTFGYMDSDQAKAFAESRGIILREEKKQWTVAEIFNQEQKKLVKKSFGFI